MDSPETGTVPNGSSPRHRKKYGSGKKTGGSSPASGDKKYNQWLERTVHTAQDSLLSTTSGYTNYRGFLNLALLLLALSNMRVALENVIKYGILVNPLQWLQVFLHRPYDAPNLALVLFSNVFIVTTLVIERFIASTRLSKPVGLLLHTFTLCVVLTFPACVVTLKRPNPVTSTMALMLVWECTQVSYVQVNSWIRDSVGERGNKDKDKGKAQTTYPKNLTLSNMYYFMFAPTLCYELNFPRSPRRRKWFLARRLAESAGILLLNIALAQQWGLGLPLVLERLLKLAVPNHLLWLMGFYCMFHSMLNAMAEILLFADRCFYRDWWNSETLQYFWSSWNMPVHRWALRHLYVPMVDRGFKSNSAATMVFFVSAFFHEYLVSVPLHMFRLWAFMGMLAQMPLGHVTKYCAGHSRTLGNFLVWLSIILGQPLCILMYYHDWYLINYPIDASNGTVPEMPATV